ncbi:PQQ-dependent sugar dehydrogenase [Oceanobacillus sp. 1P07AA]|uniref:PQQ-dependent sugar dehydrogenase n=1 Tax=Oceanobacillus sp. 1P07AA TaxID=3132293 RepID=UPI0039A5BF9A
MRIKYGLLFCFLFITGCAEQSNPSPEEPSDDTTPSNKQQVIASQLQTPWAIAQVDETIYLTERPGNIVEISESGDLTRKPVEFIDDLAGEPESGLLGIAFPNDFTSSNRAYIYYSYHTNNGNFQRITTISEQEDSWVEEEILLDEIPGGTYHHGGRIQFGPDNLLYITVGDASEPELAQDLDSLAGKVLRMNPDGSIPENNPFDNSYVYSYGHRNPQGLAWNEKGELYATEHGNSALDEINLIEPGSNYGWPVIEGDETEEDMVSPIIHSGEDTWAPSGMEFANDVLYFATLRGESVKSYNPGDNEVETIFEGEGRIRDVKYGNNGLYIITNNTDGRGDPSNNDDRLIWIPLED